MTGSRMRRHYSLQQRLFALTSALGIGVTLLLASAFVAVRLNHIQQDLAQQVELAAKVLSVEIASDAPAADRHTLQVLGDYPYIDYACCYDGTGALVAASSPQAVKSPTLWCNCAPVPIRSRTRAPR